MTTHVDLGVDQRAGAVEAVLADADRRADAQPAERILGGLRVAAAPSGCP